MEHSNAKAGIREISRREVLLALVILMAVAAMIADISWRGRSENSLCSVINGGAQSMHGAMLTDIDILVAFPSCFSGKRVAFPAIIRPYAIDGSLFLYGNKDFAISETPYGYIVTELKKSDLSPMSNRYLEDGYLVAWVEGVYVYSGNNERPGRVDDRMMLPVEYIRISERFGDEYKIDGYSDVAYERKPYERKP